MRSSSPRPFAVLWSAGTLTELGVQVGSFCYPLLALALTGSATAAALAQGAAMLGLAGALLPAGVLADRLDVRRLLVSASAVAATAYASLAVAGLLGALTLAHLLVVGLLTGAAAGVIMPAHLSAIRAVVPADDLPVALSQDQARMHVASLVGGPLGGALLGLTRWLPFAADAAMFAGAWATLRRLGPEVAPARPSTPSAPLRELAAGIAQIGRTAYLRVAMAWSFLGNLLINAIVFVAVIRMARAGWPAAQIGLVETVAGVGGLLGAAIAPWLIRRVATGRLVLLVSWLWVPLLAPMVWWGTDPYVVGASLAVSLLLNPTSNAAMMSYRIAITPTALQGRVNSTMQFVSWAAMPLAPLLGGLLLAHLSGVGAELTLALACLVPAVLVTASRSVRSVPRPAQWVRAEEAAESVGSPAAQAIAAGSVADHA